jgi:hypothetical protein
MDFRRRPKGFDESDHLLFDDCGHLTSMAYSRLKRRLDQTGHWKPLTQSEILAEQIDYHEAGEIWGVLMWNALPSPELAAKLSGWMRAGMPLRPDARLAVTPLPSASERPLARAS